jgi:hypothetical protein
VGKKFYLSKTLWFNVLWFVVYVAGAYGFDEFLPDQAVQTLALAAVAGLNLILRFVTRGPVEL